MPLVAGEPALAGRSVATAVSDGAPPHIVTAHSLMSKQLPPVRWTVPGLLPEGVVLLAGKPKMGKSWFALGAALAVAAGDPLLGGDPPERGEVLYLALEDHERRLQERLHRLLGEGAPPDTLAFALDWERLDAGGDTHLERWAGARAHARLVVIDTLARVR